MSTETTMNGDAKVPDGTTTLVVRETAPRRTYMLTSVMAAMAALAEMPAPPSPRSIKRNYRTTSEKGYRPYPKLRGSERNKPCEKCGKKQKRCIC